MKNRIIIICLAGSLLVIGLAIWFIYCKKSYHTFVYDKSGNKIGELFYLNRDTSSIYKMVKFYANGKQKEIAEVKHGVISGYKYYFDSSGGLKQKSEFIEGVANGYSYFYNDDRSLYSKSFWLNGVQCGDVLFYKNDSLVLLYNAIDYLNKSFYIVEYDTTRNIKNQEGITFSPTLLIHNKINKLYTVFNNSNSISISKNDEILITVAQPPNTMAIINVELKNNENRYTLQTPVYNCISTVTLESLKPGRYNLFIKGELINSRTQTQIRKDSIGRTVDIH